MGKLFRYIADEAIKPPDRRPKRDCHACEKEGTDVYDIQGNVAKRNGTEGAEVYSACVRCIQTGRVEPATAFEVDEVIRKYLATHYKDRTHLFRLQRLLELATAYRRTPNVPLFLQHQDWPLCCGDLTEFTGSPKTKKELVKLSTTATYWQGEVMKCFVNFEETGAPESLREVSRFRCLTCPKVYWTWQFT